ncbi:hypothetical protein XSP_000144 [Xanthomonas euroxanthea]|uniref:Uncharacterized protein n=1 Tax=Xanthomonas euroxanthea TaxID=2259622 RepID=A0A8E4EHX9_9XANT|nr:MULTISPECIES: hypothetical protein [Xanthomonas]CAD1786085.1 hypothetical protein XSP_000144 [Xanthomonas euroxanthea]
MATYPSEPELVLALDHHDGLVRQCAAGALSFEAFCAAYDNFYWAYALDGHESDATGQALLGRLAARIAPHRALAETVLAHLHPEAPATHASYGKAGRLGTEEAMMRLKLIAAGLLSWKD